MLLCRIVLPHSVDLRYISKSFLNHCMLAQVLTCNSSLLRWLQVRADLTARRSQWHWAQAGKRWCCPTDLQGKLFGKAAVSFFLIVAIQPRWPLSHTQCPVICNIKLVGQDGPVLKETRVWRRHYAGLFLASVGQSVTGEG